MTKTLYKVERPTDYVWTDDYDLAYQEATGMQLKRGEDGLAAEERITAFGISPRTVECVHCGDAVSESLIEQHHTDEHPMKRWQPAWYPRGGA